MSFCIDMQKMNKRIKFINKLLHAIPWMKKILLYSHLKCLNILDPLKYVTILDRYIIRKFIGTYIYSILLIISISIVFDVNENLAKFTQYHAPVKAIVVDYYMNFVPYFANLFSPLFRVHCRYIFHFQTCRKL